MKIDIAEIQKDLRGAKLDGWLFYDFRGRDPIAHRILELAPGMRTRRWFYFVPAKGTPKKLVHKIESAALSAVPGETLYYAGQDELRGNLKKILGRTKKVAMQYSPKNAIPYVSMVDAGTVELVRSLGPKVVTSADLVQKYEACWSKEQLDSHRAAGRAIDRIVSEAFQFAAKRVREKQPLTEYDLQQWILQEFDKAGITTEEGPDIAVNANASDPHYGPTREKSSPIREGDLLLLDVWGKQKKANSVYYDITWMGFMGPTVPEKYVKIFNVLREARDRAVELIRSYVKAGKRLQGWQVDQAARKVVEKAGYGKYFFHRTGHKSKPRFTAMGSTWTGSKHRMKGILSRRPVIPWNRESICPSLACARKSMFM